jgi:hypothetical protein
MEEIEINADRFAEVNVLSVLQQNPQLLDRIFSPKDHHKQ